MSFRLTRAFFIKSCPESSLLRRSLGYLFSFKTGPFLNRPLSEGENRLGLIERAPERSRVFRLLFISHRSSTLITKREPNMKRCSYHHFPEEPFQNLISPMRGFFLFPSCRCKALMDPKEIPKALRCTKVTPVRFVLCPEKLQTHTPSPLCSSWPFLLPLPFPNRKKSSV